MEFDFTELPQLKKQKKKKEADVTPKIIDWFVKNYNHSVAVEVKIKNGELKQHQQSSLQKIVDKIFSWKIPDLGQRNPFDFIVLKMPTVRPFIVRVCDKHCIATRKDGLEEFEFYV